MPQNQYIHHPYVPVPSDVQNVVIPNGITEIRAEAFLNHRDIRYVTIPDSVTEIGSGAFWYCDNLQSVTLPDNIVEIDEYAFEYCRSLKSITIPNGVTEIRRCTFNECTNLETVTLPVGLKKIEDNAFSECRSLRTIIIPDGVTSIGDMAFEECSSLQSVAIPNSIKKIGVSAFFHCPNLQSITIPDNVKRIENGAFACCNNLKTITFKGVNIAPFINIREGKVDTFDVVKTLIEYGITLNEYVVNLGIDLMCQGRLDDLIPKCAIFGEMRLPPSITTINEEDVEALRRCFASQSGTQHHIPKILNELAITAQVCKIPIERLASTFDVNYTKDLIAHGTPLVPAEACHCYYDKNVCDALIQKGKASVMAEAISLYNASQRKSCYKHLMNFIVANMDARTEDLLYAVDHASDIPIKAGTTLSQIREYRTYTNKTNREVVDGLAQENDHSRAKTGSANREAVAERKNDGDICR